MNEYGTGQMAQWVEYLLGKHENLSLDSQVSHKKSAVAVHACHSSGGALGTHSKDRQCAHTAYMHTSKIFKCNKNTTD